MLLYMLSFVLLHVYVSNSHSLSLQKILGALCVALPAPDDSFCEQLFPLLAGVLQHQGMAVVGVATQGATSFTETSIEKRY
jgi:hypothetical protein